MVRLRCRGAPFGLVVSDPATFERPIVGRQVVVSCINGRQSVMFKPTRPHRRRRSRRQITVAANVLLAVLRQSQYSVPHHASTHILYVGIVSSDVPPDNATLPDICRCMVGAWPTHLDRHWQRDELLQAMVDGVLQPMPRSGPSARDDDDDDAAPPKLGGGGGASELDPKATAPPAGLCTGVVFRGPIGGDRAVRANVPFPFLGTMMPGIKPTEKDFARGRVVMTSRQPDSVRLVQMQFPDEFLARVKEDAPFATLWPGHAPDGGKHAEGLPAAAAAAADGGDKGVSGRAASPAASSGNGGDGGGKRRDLRLELDQLPSSGPAPFFHAGYTAYFEITLGETLAPLDERNHGGADLECVAIGLANERFRLRCERNNGCWSCASPFAACTCVVYDSCILSLSLSSHCACLGRMGSTLDRALSGLFCPYVVAAIPVGPVSVSSNRSPLQLELHPWPSADAPQFFFKRRFVCVSSLSPAVVMAMMNQGETTRVGTPQLRVSLGRRLLPPRRFLPRPGQPHEIRPWRHCWLWPTVSAGG